MHYQKGILPIMLGLLAINVTTWAQSSHIRSKGKTQYHQSSSLPPGARPLPEHPATTSDRRSLPPHPASRGAKPRPMRTRYYYYPAANVYYNPAARRYAYYSSGRWIWAPTLPPAVVVSGPRHTVYYAGPEVWIANPVHVRTYRPAMQVNIQF